MPPGHTQPWAHLWTHIWAQSLAKTLTKALNQTMPQSRTQSRTNGWLIVLISLLGLASCTNSSDIVPESIQQQVSWRGEIDLGDAWLPFFFSWNGGDTAWINDGETPVPLKVSAGQGDSLVFQWPLFQTSLKVVRTDRELSGYFSDDSRIPSYRLPFRAIAASGSLFDAASLPSEQTIQAFEGQDWVVTFSDESGSSTAEGRFTHTGEGRFQGTFLTPTGDYRFLEGQVVEDTLWLAGFDGSHVFLFSAQGMQDASLAGVFRSGSHYRATWTAQRIPRGQPGAYNVDAESLTTLRPGKSTLQFCLPDLEGVERCIDDPEWSGKVRVIQVMGTWCPNCLDETRFLLERQQLFGTQDLQIISLAFERGSDAQAWSRGASRMASDLVVSWPVLLAGPASKKVASEVLPELTAVLAFPTAIFVDRNGTVRRIHTGFSGPATGLDYTELASSFDQTIRDLIGTGTQQ